MTSFLWEMYSNRPAITLLLTGTTTIVIASEIIYYVYNKLFGESSNAKEAGESPPPPPAAAKRTTLSRTFKSKSDKPNLTPEEEEQAKLDKRKPNDLWNTVIFFPDFDPSDPASSTKQLLYYFESARMSIHICMYLASQPEIGEVIKQKYSEGLLIQVVTDSDTYLYHNNCAVKHWRRAGIEVRMKATGYLMHHKFAIIDEEALLTGSLNWTKQGFSSNQENVMVTTNKHIVKKYMEEFNTLWCTFDDRH